MTTDPTVELTQMRRRYLLRSFIWLAGFSIMIGVNISLESRLDQESSLRTAAEHAITNLMDADTKLKKACDQIIIAPDTIPLLVPPPTAPELTYDDNRRLR